MWQGRDDVRGREFSKTFLLSLDNSPWHLFHHAWRLLGTWCWGYCTASPSSSTPGSHSWRSRWTLSLPPVRTCKLRQTTQDNLTWIIHKKYVGAVKCSFPLVNIRAPLLVRSALSDSSTVPSSFCAVNVQVVSLAFTPTFWEHLPGEAPAHCLKYKSPEIITASYIRHIT